MCVLLYRHHATSDTTVAVKATIVNVYFEPVDYTQYSPDLNPYASVFSKLLVKEHLCGNKFSDNWLDWTRGSKNGRTLMEEMEAV